jgi:hypothetical protein
MSQDPELRALLAPMVERQVDLNRAAFRVDRERVLARMAGVQPERSRGFLGYALLAAAGVALAVSGVRIWQREVGSSASASLEITVSDGSATQSHGASRELVATKENTHIAATGELETAADSNASVRTEDGQQIELQSRTRVALDELRPNTNQVKLLGGVIRCTIPHRAAARAFQVVTPDVTVVDLGTVFTVSIEAPNQATRVSVEEGEVLIRHGSAESRVRAGGSWSSADAPAPPAAGAPTPEPAASVPSPSVSNTPPSAKGAHSTKLTAETLDQEAQLLREGLAAERQGRAADARSALSQLLQKYPHSPLAPDARAALARVEAATP